MIEKEREFTPQNFNVLQEKEAHLNRRVGELESTIASQSKEIAFLKEQMALLLKTLNPEQKASQQQSMGFFKRT